MDIKQQLKFFHELVCCNYDMNLWSYDADFNLVETTSSFPDIIEGVHFKEAIQKHLTSGRRAPLILETNIGLVWIAGFEFHDAALQGIHLLGASFTGRDTPVILLKKMDAYDLSVKLRSTITKMISETPVLPTNILTNYATIFHYTLNKEKISPIDVIYSLPDEGTHFDNLNMIPEEHNGIWLSEQRFLKLISEGDPGYKDALAESSKISYGVKADSGDTIRNHKNNTLTLLTLCSRASIQGGLNPSIAYSLNDYYAKVVEECKTLGETSKLCSDLLEDYVSRVREARKNADISPQIQSSCYYIQQHLSASLSISKLAQRVGYTEYYFSHKFKKEVGCSVNDFILNEKIELAKLLLSSTTESIQEISETLAFSNRSYFYSCFQKKTNLSPSEYRKQHGNLP